jgi:hypothetical protein
MESFFGSDGLQPKLENADKFQIKFPSIKHRENPFSDYRVVSYLQTNDRISQQAFRMVPMALKN